MNLVLLEQKVQRLQEQVANITVGGSDGSYVSVADAPYNAGTGGDDVAKINAAFAYAIANNLSRVHFPAGEYTLDCQFIQDNGTLPPLIDIPGDNIAITGDGPHRTIINIINATSDVGGLGVICFGVTSRNKVIFDGLGFRGENSPFTFVLNNEGCAIRVLASENVIIRNCRFESLWGFPCHDDGSTRVHVLDCSFEDCAGGPNMNGDHSLISRLSIVRGEGPECSGAWSVYSDWTIEDAQGVGASLGGNQGAECPGSVVNNIAIDGCTGGNGLVLTDGFCFGTVSNVSVRNCDLSGLVVYQSGNPGAPTTRNIRFSNVTVDSNCVHPNVGTIVGAFISGDGGHDFFNCSFTDDDVSGFRQIQAFSLNAPDCTVDGCRFQGHTATAGNKDASFGPLCTNLRLGTNNRFANGTQEFQSGCTIAANEVIGVGATDQVYTFRHWQDSPGAGRRRFTLQLDGKHTWGNGLDLEDVTLYRSAADTLKTDDTFIATALQGPLTGNVTGNVTGAVTGNATTATTLATARTINAVSFNGSANIITNWGLDQRPASPHASDDEFEGSGSPSGWTTGGSQQATAIDPYATFATATQWRYSHNVMRPSWLMLQPTNDNTNIFPIHKAVTVGTDFMAWARLSFCHRNSATVAGNDHSIAFGLSATSSSAPDGNNYVALCLNESDANEKAIQWESVVGGVATGPTELVITATLLNDAQYCLIQKISSTIHFWIAGHSGSWFWLGQVTNGASFDRAFVRISNGTTPGAPGNMMMGIDFMRFYSGADKLP